VTPATAPAVPGPRTSRDREGRGRPAELTRAAAGPVICAVVLIALLSAWVASRGAGTLTQVRLKITLAAVPQRAFTVKAAESAGAAYTYLSIRNLTSTPDELVAVRTPIAARVLLTEHTGLAGRQVAVRALAIPGNSTVTLSPLTADVVLENPSPYEGTRDVPLTLVFRTAGAVTIQAPVTLPGTPLAAKRRPAIPSSGR
jgi:copper(I)-binding protein